jgi:hypothetical protein
MYVESEPEKAHLNKLKVRKSYTMGRSMQHRAVDPKIRANHPRRG